MSVEKLFNGLKIRSLCSKRAAKWHAFNGLLRSLEKCSQDMNKRDDFFDSVTVRLRLSDSVLKLKGNGTSYRSLMNFLQRNPCKII